MGTHFINVQKQAKYESARRTDRNRAMWHDADGLSANSLNDCTTRDRLRRRSRFEDDNNGSYTGLVTGRANETIGTGPRLQIQTGTTQAESDGFRAVEQLWRDHCEEIGWL